MGVRSGGQGGGERRNEAIVKKNTQKVGRVRSGGGGEGVRVNVYEELKL